MDRKCPICGDEMQGGKCVFCGYRPTEYDQDARRKYASQKRSMSGGPPPDDVRSAVKDAISKAAAGRKKPDVDKPVETVENPKPRAQKPPAARPQAKAGAGPPARKQQPAGKAAVKKQPVKPAKNRPGFLKRILFKALVILWVLAFILAVRGRLMHPEYDNTFPGAGNVTQQEDRDAGGTHSGKGG